MTRKSLCWFEALYLKALSYAVVYGCNLTVEQFSAAHTLDEDEMEQLRDHLASHGIKRMKGIIGPLRDSEAEVGPSLPLDQVREYILASKAASTLRGYQSDWRAFCAWCEAHAQCPPAREP